MTTKTKIRPTASAGTLSAIVIVAALAVVAVMSTGAAALAPNLECPVSPSYPKNYFRNNLPAQHGYMGTTALEAYVQMDVTGDFDLVKVGNFTGIYVRYYSRNQRRPIDEYYINVDGTPVKVIEITTTPLGDAGQFCLNFDPPTDVSEHVEGVSLNDKFFFNAYYNKTAKGARFGEITRTEFFNFARNGVDSLNILTVLDNEHAGVESMTFFKFHRTSRHVVERCEETDEVKAIDGVATRSVHDYAQTFELGNGMRVPLDVIAPAYRAFFSGATAAATAA
ncbi:hypothetical protein psal_cds_905 [Pandoravirus salinus]|uniref:Uncharacterized protein n=1 Tax=Pandoravirus salinus TaxID=1349410 RepID=S4W365_9VIRU|nr:hypothetical protein psal_cds_905 [Pandoravirus salinus]AGO85012.1 hypothetical protein psal_cds_905 [Pandoravirus salinus]